VTAAAAGYLAVQRAGRERRGVVRATSRTARNMEMARISGRAGGSFALHRARRTFASAERREELDAQFELRTAEQVAEALGHMKGALMKIGQMASYLDQGLPEPVREALASLQADAPPMAAELATECVERGLGQPVDRLFVEFDPVPIASASIGQVHRAITRDERAVAVKVQYPGIDEAIRADLDNAGMMFGALGMMLEGLDAGPLIEELRTRLLEELDYHVEAANQQLFSDYFRDHPFIHVPAVLPELSSATVLTSELASGSRFADLERWSQAERDLAAEAIYRFVFGGIYRIHAFNGDPHPGNYLFEPGGRVTFLDFGLVKHFTAEEVGTFERMIRAMVCDKDLAAYRRAIADAGLLPLDAPFSDEQVEDYFGHFYEFIREDRTVTISPEWSSASVRRFMDPGGPYTDIMKQANLPPAFVIIQRINLGLFAVLGDLGATANWRRIAEELWPWVNGPPSTPLGEQEAAWRRTHASR
jgi:predicted unusual protein kinase regulating ubiquinone biosynthesis (AarF/ABC1/UbiB family)